MANEVGYPQKEGALPTAPLPPTSPKPSNLRPASLRTKFTTSLDRAPSDIDNRSEASRSSRGSFQMAPQSEDDWRSSVDEEASELETESEAEELESETESKDYQWSKDGFESFDVHPMHCTPKPTQPLNFPGCNNVSQMAAYAATDTHIGVRQHRLVRTRLHEGSVSWAPTANVRGRINLGIIHFRGELIFNALSITQVVPLMNAEVAYKACTGPMAKGHSVVVIKAEASMESRPSSARRASIKGLFFRRVKSENEAAPLTYGWVFYCHTSDLPAVLQALGEHGCTRNNLMAHYKISGGNIGSGSFGSVMHATATSTGAMAAVKALKQGTKMQTIHAEVNMLVRAQGHEKVIKFRGCFCEAESSPNLFLVFDVHPYGDLYDRVASCTRMTEKDAMPLVRDLCEALKHIHAKQIFHRDVKPENLLMANGRTKGVVLTDFGISTLVTDEVELKKNVGTIGYASPEMLKGEATSFEGDAFGAGIVLYFMLSKSTPFLAPSS